jgi:signal recognition particle receptor subunit beta
MWDELVSGAIGAVVLVDTRRLQDAFAAIDFFESRDIPFIIALNDFDESLAHTSEEVREALAIGADVPIVRVDARRRESAKSGLIALVKHALTKVQR